MSSPFLRVKLADLASTLRHGGREMDAHLIDLALREMKAMEKKIMRLEGLVSDRRVI